ncbi:hypothetical protein FFK22_024750 [Mycobacterium sp. KBS0706]|uniref:hypothetical protein n=1 Tax=Mycobacterium sp. KBS0706 TaxID=2578109 RepID=UPI00110F8CB0|nr:hypothetical protein [Mycobacterium sp. KBS0706]TSD86031.1 hypothetical protein FFK22_024750 [Mycobacterium sp. KBS0706]
MTVAHSDETIRKQAEEYEWATLQALGAMDVGRREEKVDAFKRFYLVYMRIIELPYEHKVMVNRHLLERGRICTGDPDTVIRAMGQMADEKEAREADSRRPPGVSLLGPSR